MNLVDNFMENCCVVDKTHTSDGLGGFTTQWVDGAEFKAAIVKDSTLNARIAEKEGVTEIYTVTTAKGLGLEYHDVIKRLKDGAVFRITSNSHDSQTPDVATFSFEQVSAERWELK